MQLTIGQRIRKERMNRSILDGEKRTQQWLADQLNVSKSAVVKWENDVQRPSAEQALKLANLFGVPPDTFVSPESSPPAADLSEPAYDESREERDLARIAGISDPLIRTLERESLAAVIRAQGMRDACRAARIEAERAPARALPTPISYESYDALVRSIERVSQEIQRLQSLERPQTGAEDMGRKKAGGAG